MLAMTLFLVTARNGMTKQSMDCHGADAPRNDSIKKDRSFVVTMLWIATELTLLAMTRRGLAMTIKKSLTKKR